MSYADARLDLTSIDVACLSGLNGAGKSALLDAFTWALWESGRSSSDELIRLGQKEMWVEVDFRLDGQLYRVRRSRQKSAGKGGGRGSSKGTLELMVSVGDGSSFRSLTGSSIRETEAHITELLRMGYDTFVNSVYLRQGRADEFTTKPPAERKQILGDILGLSYFDRLQELARDQCRQFKGRLEQIEISLTGLADIDKSLEQCQGEFRDVNGQFKESDDKVAFYEASLAKLQAQLQDWKLAQQSLNAGHARLSELQLDISNLQNRKQELSLKLHETDKLLGQSGEIEKAQNELTQLKGQTEALDNAAMSLQDLNAHRQDLKTELATMCSRLEVDLDHSRSRLAELEGKHNQLVEEVSDKDKQEAAHAQYKELVAREAELAKNQQAYVQLSERVEKLQFQVTEARIRLAAEIEQKESQLLELEGILASAHLIEQDKDGLKQEAEILDKLESEFELVEQKGLAAKAELESLQGRINELRRRQKENLEKVRELEEHRDSSVCPLCSAPIVDRLAVIDRYCLHNQSMDKEAGELLNSISSLEDQRDGLRKQYVDLRQKLDSRKKLDTKIGQLNEKISATDRARSHYDQLKLELEKLKERLNQQDFAQLERESLVSVKAELHKVDFDPVIYANLQAQMRSQRHVEFRYQQLQKDLQQQKILEEALPEARSQVEQLSNQLKSEDFGRDVRGKLNTVQSQIDNLGYDRHVHQSLKEKLSQLIPCSELYRDLERARVERPNLEESLTLCSQTMESKAEQVLQLELKMGNWQDATTSLEGISAQIQELEPTLAEHRLFKQELAKQVARIESRQQQLAERKESLEQQRLEFEALAGNLDDYAFLAEAFGKKGIQAVIIENAVPEIESEANRILSRLTDNQMHIALATQHKNKSGSTVETLDLLIGDELGTRSYELYSGGEAFKVDFAVRVALSRLLARRAGAKLETLILDEGFGSQDEVSRERLVKAIGAIRGDFARILVITHIAEVKEMFPVQIHVTKSGGTSHIGVLS